MNVENCIEAQYRELMECSEPNAEYADLYKAFTHCLLYTSRCV